ncbi:MAG: SprB repeat-containing protein [Bacteroidetes bacterium]|nr:SprB repeat-containing protein [Bacteroidota bacterium]
MLTDTVYNIDCDHAGGGIDINPTGGYPPYTYQWSTGATTQDVTGLAEGVYTEWFSKMLLYLLQIHLFLFRLSMVVAEVMFAQCQAVVVLLTVIAGLVEARKLVFRIGAVYNDTSCCDRCKGLFSDERYFRSGCNIYYSCRTFLLSG